MTNQTETNEPDMNYYDANIANYLHVAVKDWGYPRVANVLAQMLYVEAHRETDAEQKQEYARQAKVLKAAAEKMDEVQ